MTAISPLDSLDPRRFETAPILRKLASASRQLAELKGVAGTIPHQGILINTLGMREAKDSWAIENKSRPTTSSSMRMSIRRLRAARRRRKFSAIVRRFAWDSTGSVLPVC